MAIEDVDHAYEKELELHLKSVLKFEPQILFSLHDIILKAKGAYPSLVKKILDREHIPYVIDKAELKQQNYSTIFSAAHPADYDWRFTDESVKNIVEQLKSLISGGDSIALFGVESLYKYCILNNLKAVLFNKSKSLLNDLKKTGYNDGLVEHDLFYSLNKYNNYFKVVIADPPWYQEFYTAFIARSAEMLLPGGYLFLSVLPVYTRPTAANDRDIIKSLLLNLGFTLIKEYNSFFRYETPSFENLSLKEEGINLTEWRTGDLWIFQRNENLIVNIQTPKPENEPDWVEFIIRDKKIKVRKNHQSKNSIFFYEHVSPTSKVLADVSRRSPLRSFIDVWTSDNYAFKVSRTSPLIECLLIFEQSNSLDQVKIFLAKKENVTQEEAKNLLNFLNLLL
ncbi:hypothetical protein GO755_37055 [Spirosoma sp. HMF4905]|uniref:Class I SAM-dependent methyltransferase n=1 Tax=Spirosoma arboris TaxID=2682092 RepID=A0A7K1SPS1_9BACT|nr:hypothetical protein [Spirosoma arboris]MVM35683.1 hypothetical protein [Spirosoma arboris]